MNNKGQAVFSEYVMIFFVVIAAAVAMTVYLQRGLQARIHDERNYIINLVSNSTVCDADCMKATGGSISYEYEPYYAEMLSDVVRNEVEKVGKTSGNPQVLGAIYYKSINQATQSVSTSNQLPPECADDVKNKPSYCTNF